MYIYLFADDNIFNLKCTNKIELKYKSNIDNFIYCSVLVCLIIFRLRHLNLLILIDDLAIFNTRCMVWLHLTVNHVRIELSSFHVWTCLVSELTCNRILLLKGHCITCTTILNIWLMIGHVMRIVDWLIRLNWWVHRRLHHHSHTYFLWFIWL